jgi:hypothetical protein
MYEDRFLAADQYVQHLDAFVPTIQDPLLISRYAGFLAVTAVTVFELAFKDIVYEFADKKHAVFGVHIRATYERLNGRISISSIRCDHIAKFGSKYKDRFDQFLKELDEESLKAGNGSVKSSYENLITWRNRFVHGGNMPDATYEESKRSYFLAKNVLACVERSLKR